MICPYLAPCLRLQKKTPWATSVFLLFPIFLLSPFQGVFSSHKAQKCTGWNFHVAIGFKRLKDWCEIWWGLCSTNTCEHQCAGDKLSLQGHSPRFPWGRGGPQVSSSFLGWHRTVHILFSQGILKWIVPFSWASGPEWRTSPLWGGSGYLLPVIVPVPAWAGLLQWILHFCLSQRNSCSYCGFC